MKLTEAVNLAADAGHAAIGAYGIVPQIAMVQEECSELLLALARYQRGRATHRDIVEEAADVIIVEEAADVIIVALLLAGCGECTNIETTRFEANHCAVVLTNAPPPDPVRAAYSSRCVELIERTRRCEK